MVLDQQVGRKRSFLRGLLLSIATAGIYSLYWNYKAHNELYRQFELHREHREEGVVWYILGLVLPPLLLAYAWTMVGNVRYVRQRLGLPAGMKPATFVLLVTLGLGLYVGGSVYNYLVNPDLVSGEVPEALEQRHVVGYVVAFLGVGALVLVPIAYRMLQREINDVWDAYGSRMRELTTAPAAPAPRAATAPGEAPARRYYADLPPPEATPEDPAPR